MDDDVAVSGSVEYLLDYKKTAGGVVPPMADFAFDGLLSHGGNKITGSPELPSISLTTACYAEMFASTSVTSMKLPAIRLATSCYQGMFRNDSAVKYPSDLSNVVSAEEDSCYLMYWQCGFYLLGDVYSQDMPYMSSVYYLPNINNAAISPSG